MKDSGSQANFINSRLVDECNLKIVETDIVILVNGVNESRKRKTNLVEVPLIVGERHFLIHAISIPELKVNLKIPGLSQIVRDFSQKGYLLADNLLTDISTEQISNIDFILGCHDTHVLPEEQISFGDDPESVYANTHAGILIFGSAERLLENISKLPSLTGEDQKDVLDYASCVSVNVTETSYATENSDLICPNSDILAIDENGKINDDELVRATEEMLNLRCVDTLGYETQTHSETSTEIDNKLVKFFLGKIDRKNDGRLIAPLMWRGEVSHLLGSNYFLAKSILFSNLKKFQKKKLPLEMIDDVFREQESEGIIQRIEDVDAYLTEHTEHSFLAHMPIFRLEKATSKCRVVFLSNICESHPNSGTSLSHNQVMHAGPSLNQKLTSSLWHLRFGEKLLCFDLRKAFLQIALNDVDSNKLLFLWFRNVTKNDFALIAYKNLRLSFGLRCSPTILMLSLYKILCVDSENDNQEIKVFKKLLYALIYMDNGAFSGDSEQVNWAYGQLPSVFSPYKFDLQQMTTNDLDLQ